MTFEASNYILNRGNLGLGVTPSAWSIGKALDIDSGSVGILGYLNESYYTNNSYFDGGWKYKVSSAANQYILLNNGGHIWRTAPSGTAGNAITFTQAMTLDASGRLGIGTTSPSYRLDVYGGARIENAGEASMIFRNNTWGNFTIGQSAFSLSGGFLSIGAASAIMTFDGTNSRVGIGTTSPGYRLHTYSNTTATQTIANFAAANYGSASSRTYIQIGTQYEDGSSRIGSVNTTGNQSALIFQTHAAASDVWNDAMYINGSGNVGIGTTSPSQKLQIAAGNIQLDDDYAVQWGGATNFILGSNASNYLRFYTNNAERMRITSGGNVGIGTSSPANKLTIQSNSTQLRLETASDPSGYHSFIESNYNASNPLNIYSSAAASYAMGTIVLSGITGVNTYLNSYYGIIFGTSSTSISSGTVRMMITNGGNVGIGTTSPSEKLHLYANASSVELRMENSTISSYIRSQTDNLNFYVNGAERMRITSGGNVLIGTTTDSGFKLDVNGKIRSVNNNDQITIKTSSTNGTRIGHDASGLYFANDDTSLDVLRIFGGTSGSLRLSIASTGAATFSSSVTAGAEYAYYWQRTSGGSNLWSLSANSGSAYIFNHTTGSVAMTILNGGNVGIGTTSPGVKLDVSSDIRTATRYLVNTGTANQDMSIGYWDGANARIEAGSAYPMLITSYQGNVRIGISGGTTMTIQSSNVGIGTTSPAVSLDVNGKIRLRDGGNTTVPSIQMNAGATIGFSNPSSDDIAVITSSTERMRITSGGNTELYGNLSLRASATGSTATHVPVFTADPASTTRSLLTRTLQDFKFDVGSFIAKGVRSNAGDYTRTLDSVNDYSLWQDNFDWDASYNRSKVIIEAQTTGNINSSNTADKQLTIGWGISSDTNFNGDDYCTVNVPLGTGAVDYNVIINGTITITSNSELKMVIRVQIASGNVIEQNVMRMANVTAAGAMLNATKNIAFTGKMNVTGTHTWSQRQTYLRLN
jgi:hypothetical protein